MLLLTGAFWVLSQNAFAACTDPSGSEGDIVYNQTHKVMQFCNGTDWISMANGFSGRIAGEIQAFSLSSCPDGWSEYTAARGRFLRGIDSTGTNDPDGIRTAGSVQGDALQNITGHFNTNYNVFNEGTSGVFSQTNNDLEFNIATSGSSSSLYGSVDFDASNVARTSTETRPKNVAVLYCEKD